MNGAWTERLLAPQGDAGFVLEARRLGAGVALAATFGAAIGLRGGPIAIAQHAVGVAAGVAAVCGLAVPALAIALAIADAQLSAVELARATSRATATAGLLLAGFAPGAALFAVTVEDAISVTLVGAGGLVLAGGLAMLAFARELAPRVKAAGVLSRVALPMFAVFGALLAGRIWWLTLPLVRGGL